jgi:hypothetical protein
MNLQRALLALSVVCLAGAGTARADETTFCNFYITTLPYTAAVQGHYCFDRNLSTAITTGNAITIDSDFVTIDLNNFKLGGGSAGPATNAVGIRASNKSNVVIRGGNIRGFQVGIMLDGTTKTSAQNLLVENNVLDGNLTVGILVNGVNTIVRGNQVFNTGGSTSATQICPGGGAGPLVMAITIRDSTCVLDNTSGIFSHNIVSGVVGVLGSPSGFGIYAGGSGRNIANDNQVSNLAGVVMTAIVATVCRDNTVLDSAGPAYACGSSVGTNSDF